MPTFSLISLDRNAYNDSIARLGADRSLGFARQARDWWDRHFSWKAHNCIVLTDGEGRHLSYIFYIIDRYREYLTIHNIFTPFLYRRHGYAKELLSLVFKKACGEHVRRFKMFSVPQSLEFYDSLGMIYWGVDVQGDYYCNLPMPDEGLEGVHDMVERCDSSELIGNSFETIYGKVHDNQTHLSDAKQQTYDERCDFLGTGYRYDALMTFKTSDGTRHPAG